MERIVQVALLAEAFAEMMDRSYAFDIYKAMTYALDKDAEKKRRDKAKLQEALGKDGFFAFATLYLVLLCFSHLFY